MPRQGRAGPSASDFLPWLPDPRLAPGCGPCAWYLATSRHGLLRRDGRAAGWQPVWPPDCDPGLAAHPHAVAARGHLLAAATPEAVYLWRREGDQLAAVIPGPAAALALAPWGELLLACDGSTDLSRFDLAGIPRGRIVTGITGRIEALATGRALTAGGTCTIWALTEADGTWQLWRGDRGSPDPFQQATLDDLAAAVDRTSLTVATDQGFCLAEPGPDGDLVTSCFTWDGQPADRHLPGNGHPADDRPAAHHRDRQRPAALPLAPGARRCRRAGRNQRARGGRHQRGPHASRDDGRTGGHGRLPDRVRRTPATGRTPARRRPTSSSTRPRAGTCTCGCG